MRYRKEHMKLHTSKICPYFGEMVILQARNSDKEQRNGKCHLTPEEIDLMLRSLDFGNDVHINVASGEIYSREETLAPLKALFPNFYSKKTIASKEELTPFSSFSSQMAALDFMICDESDDFVSNNNDNMARKFAGRRYFDHKTTICPNAKKLNNLLIHQNNMTWEEFASQIRTSQIGFPGEPMEIKPDRGEFHENPTSCICAHSEMDTATATISARRAMGEVIDGQVGEEEQRMV